jgi:hypothetical protein
MDDRSPATMAEEWIRVRSDPEVRVIGANACHLDRQLAHDDPQLCLDAILEVLLRLDGASPRCLLCVLAVGPLEDLLAENGYVVIEQVETLATQSPRFRLLLTGLWDSAIDTEILSRLARFRHQRW